MTTYIDANVFIYAAIGDEADPKTHYAKEILKKIVAGKEIAYTSILTVDEIVWVFLKRTKDRNFAITQGIRLHQLPITLLPMSISVSLSSLQFMKKYAHLGPRDALHLATSVEQGIHHFVSDDSDFDNITEIKKIKLE